MGKKDLERLLYSRKEGEPPPSLSLRLKCAPIQSNSDEDEHSENEVKETGTKDPTDKLIVIYFGSGGRK